MAWVSSKPLSSGRYRAGFTDHNGKRRTFVGVPSRTATRQAVEARELEEREISLGLRAAPGEAARHAERPIAEVVEEYLDFGKSQGGKHGRPWARSHARGRAAYLAWWTAALDLETLGDLADTDILGRAQRAVQGKIQNAGRGGKTCAAYRESLMAFCSWCCKMKYLAANPVGDWPGYDTTPLVKRRCLTREEIGALLAASPPERGLVYEVALASGLRANELRSLRVGNLDPVAGGLCLESRWTKNREGGLQPLARGLVERLAKEAEGKPDTAPLLKTTSHMDRAFRLDRERAGIDRDAFGGRCDFHSLRVAYCSTVIECGASVKEVQMLARHSTPSLTMNVYGRARQERGNELAEAVGAVVEMAKSEVDSAQSVHARKKLAVGAEGNIIEGGKIGDMREQKGRWFKSSRPDFFLAFTREKNRAGERRKLKGENAAASSGTADSWDGSSPAVSFLLSTFRITGDGPWRSSSRNLPSTRRQLISQIRSRR